ncbi:hypothetical protein BTM36_24610 [Herbaspirillum sp. VT-16-41]|nr:hypothetical protein BTM36_24610 [Herbaspirillum sp. VT-16-41]
MKDDGKASRTNIRPEPEHKKAARHQACTTTRQSETSRKRMDTILSCRFGALMQVMQRQRKSFAKRWP